MVYTVAGFLFGLLIPYMARRFSKFMPATPAYAIYRLIMPVKTTKKAKSDAKYKKLCKKYLMRSIGYAIICAVLSQMVVHNFEANLWWYLIFVWVLLLLSEIDIRMFILPDILVIPLLIAGFVFASLSDCGSAADSALGAAFGYIMPVVATLLMLWRSKDAFGGGDIKLLAAIGAWLGVAGVIYTILLSCLVFGVYSLARRQRAGAFGPSLAVSAVAVLLFFYKFI